MFFCEICKIFKNTFCYEQLQWFLLQQQGNNLNTLIGLRNLSIKEEKALTLSTFF